MKYQQFETNKLYYNKYTCKIIIHNSLASIFRSKNYSYVKKILDMLQQNAEAGLPLRHPSRVYSPGISFEDFQDACVLYEHIKRVTHDYLIRVDGFDLTIYANDESWLEPLLKYVFVTEYHTPRDVEHKEFLLNNANVVMHQKPVPYEYQVFLPDTASIGFYNFLTANKSKIKIGAACLDSIKHEQYLAGFYFWVRDAKILQLAGIACGNKFKRVIKHVYDPKK